MDSLVVSLSLSNRKRFLYHIFLFLLLLFDGSFTGLELNQLHNKLKGVAAMRRSNGTPLTRGLGALCLDPTVPGRERSILAATVDYDIKIGNSTSQVSPSSIQQEAEALTEFRKGVTEDPYGVLQSWDTGDATVCNWTGVNCSGTDLRVTSLNLSNQSLSGSISPALSRLQFISSLDLSNNSFSGGIPSELGLLVSMETLHLDDNTLTGEIPTSLSNCSALRDLGLSNNQLTGDVTSLEWERLRVLTNLSLSLNLLSGNIPETLGRLQMLQHLDLSTNVLSGIIPPSLGNCSALVILELSANSLNGEIPKELGFLPLLQVLSLRQNNLTGSIPAALGNCSSMTFLNLPNNILTGQIPKEIFSLTQMEKLYLYFNFLEGAIDPSIGNCSKLQNIALRTNHLSGILPAELGLLKALGRVTLFQNTFNGSIPPEIGNCSVMYDFSLRGNELTGVIPRSLGQLSHLQSLTLGENYLSGEIPVELANCTQLASVRLFSNLLTGTIPDVLGDLLNLNTLNLSNNLLHGVIPSSLSKCLYLTELDLAMNKLSGAIPANVLGSLRHLQFRLNLSLNQLTGSIPSTIGSLDSVQFIDLSFNNLSGSIPGSFSSCKALQSLNLSSNNLEGSIPESLATLPFLYDLNVSFNSLSGAIPDTGAFSNLTSASFAGNPSLCGVIVNRDCTQENKKSCHGLCTETSIILASFAGVSGLVIILVGVGFWFVCSAKRRPSRPPPILRDELTGEYSLSVGDLMSATQGFSDENIVGLGAHSTVYKGLLPGGVVVAVKKMERTFSDKRVAYELRREVQSLGDLRHRNLLRVYDFCSTLRMDALVLEYMCNGSLHKQLYEGYECLLTLEQRFDIIIGVAEALVYLHYECPKPIIHLDLKPSNILLDQELVPKVADFGISRFVKDDTMGEASVSEFLHGTIGYIPPEYGESANVSTKGDVYSFGVLLLELFTRKSPTDDMFGHEITFRKWVMAAFPQNILEIMDKSLTAECKDQGDQVKMIMQVGLLCTLDAPNKRPNMKDVRKLLMEIKTVDHLRISNSPSWDQLLQDTRIGNDEDFRASLQQSRSASTFPSTDIFSSTFSVSSS